MSKRSTIKDVAKQAGISLSTVSLVINRSGYVSERTRSKVLRVVKELGYHPSRAARGLASQKSGNIGFLVSDDHFSRSEPFYTRIFLGTEFEARNHNYYILLTTVGKKFHEESSVPRFLLEHNVDGIIVAGRINEKLITHIDTLGLPVVLIDYQTERKQHSSVQIDNGRGVSLSVQHLLQLGHRRIAFIGGDIRHPSLAERFESYKQTLMENGIMLDASYHSVDEEETSIESGVAAARRLLSSDARPTAIVVGNDAMAIGCIRVAQTRGMNVPDDIAVVGFDDIEMSSHIEPRLTTVRVFKEDMGKLAVQRLTEMLKSRTQTIVTIHVPVELIVRESSARKSPEMQDQKSAVTNPISRD